MARERVSQVAAFDLGLQWPSIMKNKAPENKNKIKCRLHDEQDFGYVCRHLANAGEGLGFFVPDVTDQSTLQAWCANCERLLEKIEFDWKLFDHTVGFKLVCRLCFQKIKRNNRLRLA